MVIFADLQYTIYADAGRWMGLKIQKYADVILEWSPILMYTTCTEVVIEQTTCRHVLD